MSALIAGMPVRVLVVDDQTLFREALVELLKAAGGRVSVVGTADDGEAAIRKVASLLPDVVLMDVTMPRMGGIESTARIVREHPSVRVLMLASVGRDKDVVAAIRAGAIGFVQKDVGREQLMDAIVEAAEGRQVLTAEGQRAVVAAAFGMVEIGAPPAGLTTRQFEILKLMSLGLSAKQIGLKLGVAAKTVRNQSSQLYARLHVHDRTEAILFALRKGYAA